MKAILILETRQQPFQVPLRSRYNMCGLQEHQPLFDIRQSVNPTSALFYAETGLFRPLQAGELVAGVHQIAFRRLAGH